MVSRMKVRIGIREACATLPCLFVAVVLSLAPHLAMAQPPGNACKVHDPELQGTYMGGCVNGLAEGSGEATGSARYKGEFKAGMKHGKGAKSWPLTGDNYTGEFYNDYKHGQGNYTWGPRSVWAGEKYTGAYASDKRHGHGVYEWPTGDRYAGPWVNNIAIGPATPMMIARSRAYIEAKSAVARPGIRVCREMKVGIATREWIRGVVAHYDGDGLAVRIDDPGLMGHVIRGNAVSKGALITDDFPNWTPC